MREIKFKVWSEKEKKMMIAKNAFDLYYYSEKYFEATHIMQYTGLKDKNGKEIYEGDLLKDREGFIWKVHTLINGIFKISCDDLFAVESADSRAILCELIGNIYEKPNEDMIIKIYVHNELYHVGVNEFIATQNYNTYCELFGRDNVKVERFK